LILFAAAAARVVGMRGKTVVVVVASAILMGTGIGVASAAPTLAWGTCPAETPGTTVPPPVRDPSQVCARIQVPLDYRNPHGTTIGIEISKIATTPPGEKLRDLVIEPDGDISANVAFAKRIAADCARNGGPDLPFMTTQNTARDLDRLRWRWGTHSCRMSERRTGRIWAWRIRRCSLTTSGT
jgi:hypothetical protein